MFVGRLLDGTIYGTWTCKQPDDEFHTGMEELPEDHPDVVAYINRPLPIAIDPIVELTAKIDALELRLASVETK